MNADSSAVIAGESGWVEVKGGRAGINGDEKKIKLNKNRSQHGKLCRKQIIIIKK